MFKILLRLGLRNFRRQKLYSTINIIGMTIGLLSFILIMLYVQHEQSADNFNKKKDQIFRLYSVKGGRSLAITPYIWGHNMKEEIPEVENCVSIQIITALTAKFEDQVYAEEGIVVSDSTFFEIFDYPVVQGTQATFLRHPNKIVITPEIAAKYFKADNPIGKSIEINLWGTFVQYEIQGVVNCPANSHIQFDFLVPNHLVKRHFFEPPAYENWKVHFVYTYLQMSKNLDREKAEQDFKDFLHRHMGEDARDRTPKLESLKDVYLKSNLKFDFQPRGNAQNNWILIIVALGILLMAIINFINITSAQSLHRIKEVGLRKVLGSGKSTLVTQFIGESTFMASISMICALVCIPLILPYFNSFTGKEFLLTDIFTWGNVFYLLVLALLLGFTSGIYPALVLSSYKPISILQNRSSGKAKTVIPRKIMVTLQFSLAVLLLISTGVIYQQVTYMQQRDLGFNKEQTISVFDAGQISKNENKRELLRNELLKSPYIQALSASSTTPGQTSWSAKYQPDGFEGEDPISFSTIYSDHDFLKTYDIEILQGRDFSRAFPTDTTAVLINEAAVRFFASRDSSWQKQPLHKKLQLYGEDTAEAEVIGVFKDYHHESFKKVINPLIITIEPELFLSLQIKISTEELSKTLSFIGKTWKRLFPDIPFNYKFIDQEFAKLYQSDQKLGAILRLFSILAILVAILGLFGLASFLAFEKSKEMSIRKVIGASEKQIVFLLSWLFLKLILLANLIAFPLSYFLMNRWLEAFAYRTPMPYYLFFTAFGLTLFVTALTIGYHAWKTAVVNPVKVLAQE